MLPTSGQDSFCRSNNFIRSPEARAGRGGTPQCVSRQVCIAAVSESVPLSIRISESPTICCMGKGATSAPKSAEGALRGWETIPSMQPSTIRRYCAHHDQRYISHPDEEGERQFRFAPFGHSWKKASARGSVGAQLTIQSWPPTHFLAKESTGRRISAQRGVWRATTTYGALHRLHTTTVQSGPVWKKILSPLQMSTPYEIFAKIPREPEKIRDAATTLLRPRAPRWHTHSFFKNS